MPVQPTCSSFREASLFLFNAAGTLPLASVAISQETGKAQEGKLRTAAEQRAAAKEELESRRVCSCHPSPPTDARPRRASERSCHSLTIHREGSLWLPGHAAQGKRVTDNTRPWVLHACVCVCVLPHQGKECGRASGTAGNEGNIIWLIS